jgi:hypothetical protein
MNRLITENEYLGGELSAKREEIDTLINEYVVPVSEQMGTVQLKFEEEVSP